jgi:hypothetical protein
MAAHRGARMHFGRRVSFFIPPPNPAQREHRISNRNFSRLEIAVTPTKHSPAPKSNRNFRSTDLPGGIACRAGCSPPIPQFRPARKSVADRHIQQRAPVEAGSPLSRSARFPLVLRYVAACAGLRSTHAQPAPTCSSLVVLGPGSIRALNASVARRRTAWAAGYSPCNTNAPRPSRRQPAISSRYWKLLEIAVTSTKQSPDLISNRYENTSAWGPHSCEFAVNPQIQTGRAQRALAPALQNRTPSEMSSNDLSCPDLPLHVCCCKSLKTLQFTSIRTIARNTTHAQSARVEIGATFRCSGIDGCRE